MDYRKLGFPYKAAFTHRWCDSLFLRHPADILYVRPHEGPQGLLTVVLTRPARVELDGVRVCGVINKVPVIPGKHTLRVVDGKTKQEWKSTVRLEAGKQAKVDPNFR